MAATAPPRPAAGTVKVFGKPVKTTTLLIGGVAGVGVVIYAMHRKAAAAAATPAAAALVTDPAGNQCATLDPSTGYCPGTAADISAQQAAAAVSAGSYGGGGGSGGYYVPPTGVSGTGSAVPTFTDNASWGQYVETALGSSGEDATAAAVAKYLSGQPVTSAQQTIIEEAIAIGGYPPVTGPNGNPPSMTLTSTTTTTASGPPVVVSMPNGQLGWENITFPNQAAVDAWTAWNAAKHGAQGSRSEWNAELASLGATGMIPMVPYDPKAPLGTPQNTGNPLDYQ